MLITIKDNSNVALVQNKLAWEINENSRFRVREIERQGDKVLKIREVRLKESKPYCGSHPNACDIEGGRKGPWLEGADWVEFNDRLNDVLDRYDVNAYVRSSICILRKGTRRRVYYGSYLGNAFRNEYQWNKDEPDECYEDWCGKIAPASEFPFGTPGTYERVMA